MHSSPSGSDESPTRTIYAFLHRIRAHAQSYPASKSYFERNGVDPRTSINGKFKTLELQGIERIIKIIRAIEKDKIDKLLPASEAHSDDLLKQADKQVTQLKAEVERLKKASAPDVVGRNKLGQVVRLLENAFDQKNFKKAEKGTDYFVAPVYLEMLLYKVKEICS